MVKMEAPACQGLAKKGRRHVCRACGRWRQWLASLELEVGKQLVGFWGLGLRVPKPETFLALTDKLVNLPSPNTVVAHWFAFRHPLLARDKNLAEGLGKPSRKQGGGTCFLRDPTLTY